MSDASQRTTLTEPVAAANERERELYRRRLALAGAVRDSGADALVATREGTVTYLTGYTTATWSNFSRPVVAVLGGEGQLAMVIAETEADAARQRVPGAVVQSYVDLRRVDGARGLPDGRIQFAPHATEVLTALLDDWGAAELAVDGLDAAFPPVAQPTALLDQKRFVLRDGSGLVWDARLFKSEWEVERLRASTSILERAFEGLERELRPGMTEREIHQVFGASAFRAGADQLGYTNVVADVSRGLFGAPTDRVWAAGTVLYVDGGIILDGYWADFCRMYVAGATTTAQREGYSLASRGLAEATADFEAGSVGTVGHLAERIAAACELDPGSVGFGRFGHGIGLYMPEPPSIHPLDDTPLNDGLVLCIEPAVLHADANFVVEEEYVIRHRKLVRLSPPAPPALIDIAAA